MSSFSGEAAEQVVHMSLEGAEIAVRLAGNGAKQLAILLYAILKDQRKSSGKIRLANLLRSGKELKVFAVRDGDLKTYCTEAKKYGVLYTVLKDRDAKDGLTDIMVRAEDAGKINRIFERFGLSTVDIGSVRAELEQNRAEPAGPAGRALTQKEKVEAFLDKALKQEGAEGGKAQNPTESRTAASRQSGLSSGRKQPTARDASDAPERRPSVKKQLEEIRKEQKEKAEAPGGKGLQHTHGHRPPKKKRTRKTKEAREQ